MKNVSLPYSMSSWYSNGSLSLIEECTMLTKGLGVGRMLYIPNKWRKEGMKFWLKEWDPDLPDGIEFVLQPLKGDNYYKLIIGAEDNEKVQLFYGKEGKAISYLLIDANTMKNLFKESLKVIKMVVFWAVVPCSTLAGCQCFGGTYCLNFHG
jgi:hypothetical protein